MLIGLHDSDHTGFPNLALMKLSAYHKSLGDEVDMYKAMMSWHYDKVYSSKVFTFTPEESVIGEVERGGTGYGLTTWLPDAIEHLCPDYSLYPEFPHAVGFVTRGCPNKCPWCVVPRKEGNIREHADIDEFLDGRKSVVLMDNNILAHKHGLDQIKKVGDLGVKVDFNQGLDCRLIADNPEVASLLGRCKYISFLRMACDRKAQMPAIEKAIALLSNFGIKPYRIFVYVLVKDIPDALERVEFLRELKVNPFAQPYRDFENKVGPTKEQRRFARWVNHKAIFKSVEWKDYT